MKEIMDLSLIKMRDGYDFFRAIKAKEADEHRLISPEHTIQKLGRVAVRSGGINPRAVYEVYYICSKCGQI